MKSIFNKPTTGIPATIALIPTLYYTAKAFIYISSLFAPNYFHIN